MPWPGDALDRKEQKAAVAAVIDVLRESDRSLPTLRCWEDLSIAEIARKLGMPSSKGASSCSRSVRRNGRR